MKKTGLLVHILLAVFSVCDAANILVLFPFGGKSHAILGEAVVNHCLSAGHEVTYITLFPKNRTNPKIHEIDVSSNLDLFKRGDDDMSLEAMLSGKVDSNFDQALFFILVDMISSATMDHENVQNLINDETKHFDLVIAEWMFSEVYAGFAALYNAPLIWLSTLEPHWMILSLIDEYTNPAYVPYMVDDSAPFTFSQRLTELYHTIKMTIVRETAGLFLQYRTYNRVFVPLIEKRGRVAPSFSELRYNASLVLGNSHVSMGQATRLPQNYIPVGGYHIDAVAKPLPENLKSILENAKHGVIYFSLGSNIESKTLPDSIKQSLLTVFGSLKQTVLWKFEEKFPNLPKNVHVIEWAPQQSILAHPNCVLFITHGGLLSTTETIYAGKPIIGVPIFGDQFLNIAKAVSKGFARKVNLSYGMAEDMKIEIEEILGNPKYAQKAKELSFIHHDRPASPSKEFVHWVNHVIKTGGAPHLRSAAVIVPWYQKLYLDLAAIIIIVGVLIKKTVSKLKSVIKPKKIESTKKNN